MSEAAVEQHGLLDQPLAYDLRQEIDIFLRAARAQGDVMKADDGVIHGVLLGLAYFSKPRVGVAIRFGTILCSFLT